MNFVMSNMFPVIIIGLSFWAGIVYAIQRMPLHAAYWAFAGALNLCVLFMREV